MAASPEADVLTVTDAATLGRAAFKCVNERDFSGARAILDRALSLHPKDVMLVHVWAHMVGGSGDVAEGGASLRDLLEGADTAHGLHAHTCWHLADMEAELGHPAAALELYELYVAPYVAERQIMFYSAVALLWRLELMGFGRQSGRELPWAQLRAARDHILATPSEPGGMANPPALDHIAHGVTLVTTGNESGLAGLLEELRAADTASESLTSEVVIPLILGLRAYWDGDYARAIALMEATKPSLGHLTNSDDQLELVIQTLASAGTRSSGALGAG